MLLFAARHPVLAIAYGPLIAFGLLNFVIGNRAIFYSAPILWFGAAFLLTTTARFVADAISEDRAVASRERLAAMLAASLAMTVAWVNSPTNYLPQPSFPKPVLKGLISLQAEVDPENWSPIFEPTDFNEAHAPLKLSAYRLSTDELRSWAERVVKIRVAIKDKAK